MLEAQSKAADLCKGMNNWPGIKLAVVVDRETKEDKNYPQSNQERIYCPSLYPQYAKLSSTGIQNGTMQLEPPALQHYFAQAAN